jgi:hypothetical protein
VLLVRRLTTSCSLYDFQDGTVLLVRRLTTSCSLYDFQDGTVLLVRRLPDGQIGEKNLKAEAAMLAKVKHRNLTVLRGSFMNQDVGLLL